MSELDVRIDQVKPVNVLRFSDNNVNCACGATRVSNSHTGIVIKGTGVSSPPLLRIENMEHLRNLRKALDRAEDLGWLTE